MQPLYVAIIWHMHQPYYRQPDSDRALLPWTRLHATKDYLHMAQVLAEYPDVHATFTLVPSLAEQVEDYARGALRDQLMEMAIQPFFSPDDKRYLLNICYSISWENIIRRYPHYAALLDRRHLALLNPDYFSEQMYRDLIVWFNLAWTDPNLLESDPFLQSLVKKGRDFTIADAANLMQKHVQIVGQVLPTYREMQESGQIEVITVPYYHPILPLLWDSDIALRPSPGLTVPIPPLHAAADAEAQVQQAIDGHWRWMGKKPVGMWPSEGAVSEEIVTLAAAQGIRWLATDEALLGRSLGVYFDRDGNDLLSAPEILYRPYRFATPHGSVTLIFRDHSLSDRVGFLYQNLSGEQAAEDMVVRLKHAYHRLRDQQTPGLVSIILDGENAWEYYEHNGDRFLHALYQRLSADPDLQAVTVSEYLDQYSPVDSLKTLASGSWIRGDFTTWIGDPEHNEAWRRLRDLRQAYDAWLRTDPDPMLVTQAQRYLYAAEGSDWFWWYSRYNSSDQDALFDQTFIDYLAATYRVMDSTPPPTDLHPVQEFGAFLVKPVGQMSPRLKADPDASAQWKNAPTVRPRASTGTMQQAGGTIRVLRYANDDHYLYLRIELMSSVLDRHLEIQLQSNGFAFLVSKGRGQTTAFLYHVIDGNHINLSPVTCVLGDTIAELAISLARLKLTPLTAESTLALQLLLDPHEGRSESLPKHHWHELDLAIAPSG